MDDTGDSGEKKGKKESSLPRSNISFPIDNWKTFY